VWLHQKQYILDMLKKYGLLETKLFQHRQILMLDYRRMMVFLANQQMQSSVSYGCVGAS